MLIERESMFTGKVNVMELNELKNILAEAEEKADNAGRYYFYEQLGGVDRYACGFAWVNIYSYKGENIKGNTKLGRLLKKAGVYQDYQRIFQVWMPGRQPVQNIDCHYASAKAYADVLTDYGFVAYANSRLD
jgi:predicted RNA-binding protein